MDVSSGREELQHSLNIVDKLVMENEYDNPRNIGKRTKPRRRRAHDNTYKAPLIIPYLSETASNNIRNYIRQRKLNVRPIFKPGQKLKQKFCRSRPLDTRQCVLGNPNNCKICPLIVNGNCNMSSVVYRVICILCCFKEDYNGETGRPVHDRFSEHVRAAKNPQSYCDNAIGKHYQRCHNNIEPVLEFHILDRQSDIVRRKISEALTIFKNKPSLNDKNELLETRKFLI